MPLYYVNGYGVPRNILWDCNYSAFLAKALFPLVDSRSIVYLAGGATNPCYPDRTEAGEMLRWAEHNGLCVTIDFYLINRSIDLQGNLLGLLQETGRDIELVLFCEWARQDYMRFLVGRMFSNAKVVPIKFDAGMDWLSRPRQLLRLPVKVAGYYSPTVRRLVQLPLRRRFMRRQARP